MNSPDAGGTVPPKDSWSIEQLIQDLASRRRHPAVIAFTKDSTLSWDSATLAETALRLANGIRRSWRGFKVPLALWEQRGGLVALVRPDPGKLRQRGATNFRDGIRVILSATAQGLPSYQRLSGFALTDRPLPRTRLGKYRRFLLPARYAEAAAGGTRHGIHAPTGEDLALLHDPTAVAVCALLRQRWPQSAIAECNLSTPSSQMSQASQIARMVGCDHERPGRR
jgi:hypothetical protein